MIKFEDRGTQVVLTYESDWGPVTWVDDKLRAEGEATLSRTFTVRPVDLLPAEDDEGDARAFVIGSIDDEYRGIRSDVLGLKHDLRISRSIPLTRALFVAERDISIFRRVDELVDNPIVIGGPDTSAVPEAEFRRLLHTFPTTTEMKLYAWTRITRVLREYMETMTDAEQRLTAYMARRARSESKPQDQPGARIPVANELELAKFEFVRDRLTEMLREAEVYSEAEWQATVADLFLLIFPQYVAVLRNVRVKERYSNPGGSTNRFIDLLLVAAHSKDLPSEIEISISNPKAFILAGRDSNLSSRERFDLEFARRAYSNVTDIISYDDLLRRVENIIASLTKRTESAASRVALEDPVIA